MTRISTPVSPPCRRESRWLAPSERPGHYTSIQREHEPMATTMEPKTEPRSRTAASTPSAETPAKATPKGSRRTVFLIMGVVLLGLLLFGARKWWFSRNHVSTDNAQVDGHIVPILPKVGGYVAEVRVDENHAVKAGDTLVVLDDRDFRARLAQTDADLAALLATVSSRTRVAEARAASEQAALQLLYTRITAPSNGVVSKKSVELGQLVQAGQPLMTVVPLDDIWVTANLKETETANVTPGDSAVVTVDAYKGTEFHGHVESLSPATGAKFSLLPPDNATGNFTKVVQRIPVRIRLDT